MSFGFSCKYELWEVCTKDCSATQYTEVCNKCKDFSQAELDRNLNSVYNDCDSWRLLT